jgi:hypothetical protein
MICDGDRNALRLGYQTQMERPSARVVPSAPVVRLMAPMASKLPPQSTNHENLPFWAGILSFHYWMMSFVGGIEVNSTQGMRRPFWSHEDSAQ